MEKYRMVNESINEIEEYFIRLIEQMRYLGFNDETSETVLENAKQKINEINEEIVKPSLDLFVDLFVLLEMENEDVN